MDVDRAIVYEVPQNGLGDIEELKRVKNPHPLPIRSAERFLHLAIEALLDMGNHVIADEGLGVVD
jgi:uncharacterized protein YutE (UPF0331/DUF86 family)